MYHYESCGLPNIWLKNGYEVHETPYGEGVAIEDLQGLHKVIAMSIIRSPSKMTGCEFRFLRKELNLSQKKLGAMLGVEDQTVANWEKRVPTSLAGRAMQFVAMTHYADTGFRELIEELAELDRKVHETLYFEEIEEGWQAAEAA